MDTTEDRLLVVDTSGAGFDYLVAAGHSAGYSVAKARNCADLDIQIGKFDPTVILLNLADSKPQFISLIRQLTDSGTTANVILTGHSIWKDPQTSAHLGRLVDLEIHPITERRATFVAIRRKLIALRQTCRKLDLFSFANAITNDKIAVAYAPVVNSCRSGDWAISDCTLEAHLTTQNRSILLLEDLYEVAASLDLLPELFENIIRKAVDQRNHWQGKSVMPVVRIPLHPRLLELDGFASLVEKLLVGPEADQSGWVLEIPELEVGSIPDKFFAVLRELQYKGFRLSLIDVASGGWPINWLCQLPVDEYCIDYTIINRMFGETKTKQVLKALLSFSNALGASSCASGANSDKAFRILATAGYKKIRGQFVGPASGAAIVENQVPKLGSVTG